MGDKEVFCVNCTENTGPYYIECADCPSGETILCPLCFSCAAEPSAATASFDSPNLHHPSQSSTTGSRDGQSSSSGCSRLRCFSLHLPSHRYMVKNILGPVLFRDPSRDVAVANTTVPPQWHAKEELILLDALERYCIGNWLVAQEQMAIASKQSLQVVNPDLKESNDESIVGPSSSSGESSSDEKFPFFVRSTDDIAQHYERYYMSGRIGGATYGLVRKPLLVESHSDDDSLSRKKIKLEEEDEVKPGQETFLYLSGLAAGPSKAASVSFEKVRKSGHVTDQDQPAPDELAKFCYTPERDEFEREWESGAERLLNAIILYPSDSEFDYDLAQAAVAIYQEQLQERALRKAMSNKYSLMAEFLESERLQHYLFQLSRNLRSATSDKSDDSSAKTRRPSKLKKEMQRMYKFSSSVELDRLLSDLERERLLRNKVRKLQRAKSEGFKTLAEYGAKLEQDAQQKPQQRDVKSTPRNAAAGRIGCQELRRLDAGSSRAKGNDGSRSVVPTIARLVKKVPSATGNHHSPIVSENNALAKQRAAVRTNVTPKPNEDRLKQSISKQAPVSTSDAGITNSRQSSSSVMLSTAEKSFCSKANIPFENFFILKLLLLDEYRQKCKGAIIRRTKLNCDEQRRAVETFLLDNGIIA